MACLIRRHILVEGSGVQHGFYAEALRAHLRSLATRVGLGTISCSSDAVRFVQGGVVKTFRCRSLIMDEWGVMAWLNTMTHKQFAEFFYRAVADRNTSDLPEWNGHFVLADAELIPDEPWDVDLIAVPADAEYVDDHPICQSGTCSSCNSDVRSVAKNARCPVCGGDVYCT